MPQFNIRNSTLQVSDLPAGGMSFADINQAYKEIKANLKKGVKEVSVDLTGIDHNNYSVISYIISCGELCAKSKRRITFSNGDNEQLMESLKKLGFEQTGQFKHEEFKKDETKSLFESVGEAACDFWDDTKKLVGFIGEVFIAIGYLVRHPRKIDLKEILFYMDKSGADAVPIVLLICFLVGLILAFQGIMQMAKFGLQVYVADLVALSLVRELGPLMVGMICIGRAGSAFAAELGTMKVNEEIDAMNTMGLKPARFLVIPKITALITCMPLLVILGDIAGIVGGVLIGVSMSDVTLTEYWNRTLQSLIPANVLESLIKGLVFSFIIAGVGCFRGFEADNDAKGVGKATTSSVVSGIFLVVVADFFVTFTFPQVLAVFGVEY